MSSISELLSVTEEEYDQQGHVHVRAIDELEYTGDKKDSDSGSVLMTFVKNIRPGMDLTQLKAPMFAVKPLSLLEKLADAYRPSDSLLKISHITCPRQRMLAVVQFYLGNLRSEPSSSFKQISPYNPILGEQFFCEYPHKQFQLREEEKAMFPENFEEHIQNSVTRTVLEQISHHPPISACHVENKHAGFAFRATQAMTVKIYLNSVEGSVQGSNVLHVLNPWNEDYIMEHPKYVGKGLIFGSSRFELQSEMTITCEKTNMKAVISFSKGSAIFGEIFEGKKKVITLDGSFSDKVQFLDCQLKSKKELVHFPSETIYMKSVKPVSEQSELESHRVWHGVTYAIKHLRNDDLASKIKHAVEERQRQIAQERKEKSEQYTPALFKPHEQESTADGIPVMVKDGFSLSPELQTSECPCVNDN